MILGISAAVVAVALVLFVLRRNRALARGPNEYERDYLERCDRIDAENAIRAAKGEPLRPYPQQLLTRPNPLRFRRLRQQ